MPETESAQRPNRWPRFRVPGAWLTALLVFGPASASFASIEAAGMRRTPLRPWADIIAVPGLRHRFPDRATGDFVITQGVSGITLVSRPIELAILHADGTRAVVSTPRAVPVEHQGDGSATYALVYPGLTWRYLPGDGRVTLEVAFTALPPHVRLEPGDALLLTWAVEIARSGLLIALGDDGGGMVLLDEDSHPVLLLASPVEQAPPAGATRTRVASYHADVVDGSLRLSVMLAGAELGRLRSGVPLVVAMTTVDIAPSD